MSGNGNSGNPYQIHVNPESDLGVFIDELASKKHQGKGMYILWLVLTAKPELAKEFWKENPERLAQPIAKYSQSIVQHLKEKQDTK
jgi:hypothetical protein